MSESVKPITKTKYLADLESKTKFGTKLQQARSTNHGRNPRNGHTSQGRIVGESNLHQIFETGFAVTKVKRESNNLYQLKPRFCAVQTIALKQV